MVGWMLTMILLSTEPDPTPVIDMLLEVRPKVILKIKADKKKAKHETYYSWKQINK